MKRITNTSWVRNHDAMYSLSYLTLEASSVLQPNVCQSCSAASAKHLPHEASWHTHALDSELWTSLSLWFRVPFETHFGFGFWNAQLMPKEGTCLMPLCTEAPYG